ncbi:aquaporin [Chlorogloeopsis sp. ULAP02]|uniref:aquaporin n=1 Tax=Chlorogloeopsis sp. ULAP02 TaxID=3107926 RepID=UPI003135DF83
MNIVKLCIAEFIGTFWLVLGGTGSAVLATSYVTNEVNIIQLVGVSLAFGLTVLIMAYVIGHISGCQRSPLAGAAGIAASLLSPSPHVRSLLLE